MNERYEVAYDRFSCRPPEAALPSGETVQSADTGSNRGATILSFRFVKSGTWGRFAACLTAGCIIPIMLAFFVVAAPAKSFANSAQVSIGVVVRFGPPALPYYAQPMCPGPGYIWTPGYWAWDPIYGYYWVPGTWVLAPFPGALWTPGYWAWDDADDGFVWYSGYWGPVVGFYGGIDYGYGYTGYGYQGGYWRQGVFYYNRAVNQVNVVNVRYVYYERAVVRNASTVSYNGGPGGISARPDRSQLIAERDRQSGPLREQLDQSEFARRDPGQRASYNHGVPPVAATPRTGQFMDRGVVHATRAGAPYHPVQPSHGAEPRGTRSSTYTPVRHHAAPSRSGQPAQPAAKGQPHRTVAPRSNAHPPRPARPQPGRRAGPSHPQGENPHQNSERGRGKPSKPHRPCCSLR